MASKWKASTKYQGVTLYLPTGKWRARWRGADGTFETKPGFQYEEDAHNYRVARLADIGNGVTTRERDRKQLVGTFASKWLANLKATAKSPGTYRAYSQRWRCYLAPTFERMQLKNVTRAVVRDWQADELGKGRDPRTVAAAQTVLNMVLTYAVDSAALTVNPIAGLARVPVPKLSEDYKDALPEATIAAILDAADPRYLIAFELALYAGLRSGEFRGLSIHDVSETPSGGCRLEIWRQLGWSKDGLGDTKTHNKETIEVDGYLYGRIMEHVEQFGTAGKDRLILSHEYKGQPVTEQRWTEIWNETVERAGVTIPKGTGVHSFRIACGSYIYGDRKDLTEVQRILRHANLSTTAAHYVKRTTDGTAASASLVNRFATARKARARGHLKAV